MDGADAVKSAATVVWPEAPTMLCIWHVNQCVLAYCKKWCPEELRADFLAAWHKVLYSSTENDYNTHWKELTDKYSTLATQKCVDYLCNEWLKNGQKERVVTAWTNKLPHLKNQTTSRYSSLYL